MTRKKKEKNKRKKGLIIGSICVALGLTIIIIAIAIFSFTTPKTVKLSPSQSVSVNGLVVAIAVDRVNNSGSLSYNDCEAFRTIAKDYNAKTDWFNSSYCKYIIYADYNDTENTTTITLGNGTHAAIYIFDSNREELLDYKFIESTSKGYGILIK